MVPVKAAAPLPARSTTLRSKQPKPMPPNAHLPPSASLLGLSSIGKAARQGHCRSHNQLLALSRQRGSASSLTIRPQFPGRPGTMAVVNRRQYLNTSKRQDGVQTRHLLQLRRLRRQYRSPLRPRSTKAFSRWPNPSVVATSRIFASWPHSHVSFAAVIPPILITYVLRNQEPWAPKSVMSSPCHCVGDIIVNCIKLEMRSPGGRVYNINAMPVARQLWEQTHPNENQTEAQIAGSGSKDAKIEN